MPQAAGLCTLNPQPPLITLLLLESPNAKKLKTAFDVLVLTALAAAKSPDLRKTRSIVAPTYEPRIAIMPVTEWL